MNILFVCTGNTCRSPMAERLLSHKAELEGLAIHVRSAGVSASPGGAISNYTATILDKKNISHHHTSQLVSDKLVDWADLVLAMTFNHKQAMIQRFPYALDKIHLLKEYVEDNPQVLAAIAESEGLYSELELKHVLSLEITAEERQRMWNLENNLPNYDIFDPFGGSLEDYERCAEELEMQIQKFVNKLAKMDEK